MTRPSPLALGLLALALAFAGSPRASADEPKAKDAHAPAASAAAKHDATPATPAPITGHESAPTTAHANPAAGHGDAGGGHEQPNILAVEAPLAIWTVIVFGVLLLILARFAWKPMMKALHDREEHIEHCLLEAERARNEAERLMAENQKNLAKAAEQMRAMIETGKKEGEAIAASIVQKAQAEAEASRETAKRDIESARDQALGEIFTKTADLAVSVAGTVLSKNLSADDQRRLTEAAMAELPAMANGRGAPGMTSAPRPDPDLVAGTVFDEADADLARTYASALLGAVGDDAGAVLDELGELLTEVVRGQPRFNELMTAPTMAASDRDRVLVELFEGRALPPVVNLLRVLNRHGRLGLLSSILGLARDAWDRKQGRRPVTVRSAVPLDDAQRGALEGRLSSLIGATPVLTLEVDPSLIAGLVVQVGDDVYDASVRTRLRRLRERLIERKSHVQVQADEIASVLEREIKQFKSEVVRSEVGRVLEVGDGIARVHGLAGVMNGEMVSFEGGVKGLALNLEEPSVGVIVLGDFTQIHEGETVTATGELLRVPVGDALVGRVVNALGEPIDNKGPVATTQTRLIESHAPGIAERQPVDEPLQTGVKAIDAMTPIGRGQRQLIIGDRKTGKTAIAIDAILNQKGRGVICVYVAIAQKESTVAGIVDILRKNGAMDYTIVVVAGASDPAPMAYLAPYAGCAMSEYFMYEKGAATLCIYDDLSKQAVAYRELSLLLRRPPGREAYPGDIFYAHSRLLERSAKLANKYVIVPESTPADAIIRDDSGVDKKTYLGVPGLEEANHAMKEHYAQGHKVVKTTTSGGSQTALPLIETLEGEVSAYIPTNVISITDGQIYLQPALFAAGVRPAVDVGISVSRVGSKAQIPAMKKVAGGLRLDLAAFRELEAFAQLGTELDKATQLQLDRGRRMVELLKQPQYRPYHEIDQAVSIFAGSEGYMDDVPVKEVGRFEEQFLEYMRTVKADLRNRLLKEKKLTDPIVADLKAALAEFKSIYRPATPATPQAVAVGAGA